MGDLLERHVHVLRALNEERPLCIKQLGAYLTDIRPTSVSTVAGPCLSYLVRLGLVSIVNTWPRGYTRTPAGTAELAHYAWVGAPAPGPRRPPRRMRT